MTEQEPEARMHEVELNCELLPTDVENVTVPVGLFPDTVTVHVVGEPMPTVAGEHETEFIVV